jgi:radical SAM protein with 4Fe4S-binding SPASM domain
VLALLRERSVPAQLISNGGLVTDRVADRLASHGVRAVQITLNGPNPELHAEHTGDVRHFEAALGGVRTLAERGIHLVGCTVLTHLNAFSIGATVALWQSLGVRDLSLSRFSPAGRALEHAPRLLPTRDDVVEAFAQARPYAAEQGMRISCTMPIPPCILEPAEVAPIGFGSCAIGTPLQELALGPDGALRNCTLHREPIGGVADVLDPAVDLAALPQADEVTGYRKRYPEFCQGCLHAQSCGGGCGAAADWMLGSGPRRMPDPFLWQHIDDELGRRLGRAPAPAELP